MTLKLRRDNPYSKGVVFRLEDNTFILQRGELAYKESPNDIIHVIIQNERLDTIAYKYYKNSKLWWVIADVNNVFDPFDLSGFSTLVIPNILFLKAYNLL